MKEAYDAAEDGAKLTGQLLAFSRRQPLNPKPTDLSLLISNFSELLRRSLGELIELNIRLTGRSISASLTLHNCKTPCSTSQSMRETPCPAGGKLTIEVSQARLDADYAQMYPEVRTGRFVLIAVTDTGAGMSDEVRQRAFEPFFTTKPTGSGTGLGLSMVYGFVRQSGGNIQIYSELERGTSIRIFLPLAEAAQASGELGSGRRRTGCHAARIRNHSCRRR